MKIIKKVLLIVGIIETLFLMIGCFGPKEEEKPLVGEILVTTMGSEYFIDDKTDGSLHFQVPVSFFDSLQPDTMFVDMFGSEMYKSTINDENLLYLKLTKGDEYVFAQVRVGVRNNSELQIKYNYEQIFTVYFTLVSDSSFVVEKNVVIELIDNQAPTIDHNIILYCDNAAINCIAYNNSEIPSGEEHYYASGETITQLIINEFINSENEDDELIVTFYTDKNYEDEVSSDDILEIICNHDNQYFYNSNETTKGIVYTTIYFKVSDSSGNSNQFNATIYLYDSVSPVITNDGTYEAQEVELNQGEFEFMSYENLQASAKNWINNSSFKAMDEVSNKYVKTTYRFGYNNDGTLKISVSDGSTSATYTDKTTYVDMSEDIKSNDPYIDYIINNCYYSCYIGSSTQFDLIGIVNNISEYVIIKNEMIESYYHISGFNPTRYTSEFDEDQYKNSLNNKYVAFVATDEELYCNEGSAIMLENDESHKVYISKNVSMSLNSLINLSSDNVMDVYLEYSEAEYNALIGEDVSFLFTQYEHEGWLYGDSSSYVLHFDCTLEDFELEFNLNND